MKITKSQLKQIIKEALGTWQSSEPGEDKAIEELERIMTDISNVYDRIKDPESQEIFEKFLNENVALITQAWQKDRASAIGKAY